jgi:hypothetical protein
MAHQFGSAGYSREEVLPEIPITGFFFSVDVSMGTLAVDEPPAPRVRPPVDVGYFRAHETPIDPCWLRLAASFALVAPPGDLGNDQCRVVAALLRPHDSPVLSRGAEMLGTQWVL